MFGILLKNTKFYLIALIVRYWVLGTGYWVLGTHICLK